MKLSMHILKEDMGGFELKGKVSASITARPLEYPMLCAELPDSPSPGVLYIMPAESLPPAPPKCARLSVVCEGRPSDAWANSLHDVLWSDTLGTGQLMNEAARAFWRYGDWDVQLRSALSAGTPLQQIASVAQPFFPNSIALLSTTFRMLFVSFPEVDDPSERYERYRSSSLQEGGGFMRDSDVVSVVSDEQFERISSATQPVVFDASAYDYATLVYNVVANGVRCAYLCSDDVVTPHTPRVHALVKYLGDLLASALESDEDVYALTHPEVVRDTLQGLLGHRRLVSQGKIDQTMRFFGWNENDVFAVTVITLSSTDDRTGALDALAASIARTTGNDCYRIVEDAAVFVFSLSSKGIGRAQLENDLAELLQPLRLVASVSTCFDDFKDLYYYYRQARDAGTIGQRAGVDAIVRSFDETATDYAVAKLADGTIPAIYVPDELKRLVKHDQDHGTDYTRLLGAFLRNERSIALTTRQEYMHRSTFNYRMARIAEILGMDLDDPDVRFRLLLAYRMLEHESRRSS